jgi:hypothetical protein
MAKKGLGPSSAVLTTLAMLSLMAVVESGKNLLGKGVFTSQPPCQVKMIISTFYVVILVGLFDYEVLRVSFHQCALFGFSMSKGNETCDKLHANNKILILICYTSRKKYVRHLKKEH